MEQERNDPRFPEQPESAKIHGTTDNPDQVAKMKSEPSGKSESKRLTDVSGEEKQEDYINTDEREKDLDGTR